MLYLERESQFIDNPEKLKEDEVRQKILDSLERIGFHEKMDEENIKRLMLLEQNSEFNEDSRKIVRGMKNILDFVEKNHADYPQLAFSDRQKLEGGIAAILHDIGKSGPVEATDEESEIIVRIFAQEQIEDPALTIGQSVIASFSENERKKIFGCLKNLNIDPGMSIRQLWDLHAQWTHDILEKHSLGLSKRVRVIASSHHIDHGINPYALPESEIPLQSNIIGTLEEYIDTVEERVLMAVDQYEALVRRKDTEHEDAIALIRQNLSKFKQERVTRLICDVIDKLGREGKLFL